MKKDELSQTRNKTLQELRKELKEKKQELTKIRLEVSTGKIKNMKAGKSLRRDIAQLSTIIRDKEPVFAKATAGKQE
ncbi:50S ribosomal protein L29 [Candidatus Gottesmanbacteria bacterium]|nr:50S ribosomal protein L29 [Candidatus Gottesmanbacteria bacterium]MBI5465600.1 50S ribosomal protein L29 [Candidatus Gottesmanbacteria bacterium]